MTANDTSELLRTWESACSEREHGKEYEACPQRPASAGVA
jgi:hypothetical protein